MSIKRTRTDGGYISWLVCPICDQSIKRLDPQSPIWSLYVSLDDHVARDHRTSRNDDAVGRAYYKHPGRGVTNLELPET